MNETTVIIVEVSSDRIETKYESSHEIIPIKSILTIRMHHAVIPFVPFDSYHVDIILINGDYRTFRFLSEEKATAFKKEVASSSCK